MIRIHLTRLYHQVFPPTDPAKAFHDALQKHIADLESTFVSRNLDRIAATHQQAGYREQIEYLRGIAASGIFPPNPGATLTLGKTPRSQAVGSKNP